MTVALWFLIGFLIGGCCSATVMCCALVKHLIKSKSTKKE